MILASSRVVSNSCLQARGCATRLVAAPALPHTRRAQLISRPALETKSDVAETAPSQDTEPAQPAQPVTEPTLQDKVKGVLQALYANRRLVAVVVAVLDVAFLWVAIKLGKTYLWDPNH
uniref:Uncharacterized protein n=1 Tax=Chlamydomonas leiostraca TaxID=1034604 RepID=A0A7S0S4L3_9CHLO|mmetsp:Transcript_8591/g.21323  ORF Transcript_8591/g.21323 Transcript_8591/m.21323 type:complete len:119 (+) Transcript_8591:51-407(+)|eukprot:CAMPEP_0202866164 /NCGR_PEP_ID=MMETSP1391-20130828/7237_1 /ASSEMBLY_ACC=CAM_ASM_000867 /TAXON_ID=1034604 /ORGANISM="Chlamydomonas leiostraca, Strain SAG 11-49" /LENGTH=118 /DNA_ID=CAMNT_0049546087 /DNA_START=51 /DNA_END=407 /DNA_ORIENTATION=-